MARRRYVRGAATIKKLLQRLPDQAKQEMVVELNVTGRDMLSRIRSRSPEKTGATKRGLSFKVYPKTLKLMVGLISTKAGRSKLFYARIQDLGRRAQTVTVRRFAAGGQRLYFRGKKFGPSVQTYPMNVPAMKGRHFITGRMPELRETLNRNLKGIWERALRASGSGLGNE